MIKKFSSHLLRASLRINNYSFSSKPFSEDSYYNWDDPRSFKMAVQERYFLKDILNGYYHLKEQQRQLNQHETTFLAYIYFLFPDIDDIILPDLVKAFNRLQEHQSTKDRIPQYIKYLRNCNYKQKLIPFLQKMRNRINDPSSFGSLEQMKINLSRVGFDGINELKPFFKAFRNNVVKLLEQKQYKLSKQQIRIIIEIHQNVRTFDQNLDQESFLMKFPPIFRENEEIFKNMLTILPHLVTKNFIHICNKNDCHQFHKQLGECKYFKQNETKVLLRKYAEHLTICSFHRFVLFRPLLDPMYDVQI